MNKPNFLKETLAKKELFIFDMDGTIYLGDRVFDAAVRYIDRLRKSGKHVLFFTNNASHTSFFYRSKLSRLGFSPQDGEIMTSGDVTKVYLNRFRPGKTVFLVGTDDLTEDFRSSGIPLADIHAPRADLVVTSFDTSLTYEKLEAACRFIRDGAEYLSTHPDFNCPTEHGFIPDSGAIAAFVTASTGVTPVYFGKPYPETVQMICEATGCTKNEMCVFGDRLYTDIALGVRNGVTSVLVMTGETTKAQLEAAAPEEKPSFVIPSFSALL